MQPVSRWARRCPHCGIKMDRVSPVNFFVFLGFLLLTALIVAGGGYLFYLLLVNLAE
jgi:hypothetical protein